MIDQSSITIKTNLNESSKQNGIDNNKINNKSDSAYSSININNDDFDIYNVFEELCQNNSEYYRNEDKEKGQKMFGALIGIIDQINNIKPLVKEIRVIAPKYDLDLETKGNGYRSFLFVVDSCIKHGIKLNTYIKENRNSLLFRKGIYVKEIESCLYLLASIANCFKLLIILDSWSQNGDLFPVETHTTQELLNHADPINQYCFYGRCLGFQFCESLRPVLKFITICMASFSETYYSNSGKIAKATSSMWTSGKYFLDPELRAKRLVEISQNSNVDFCKAFWFLNESELLHILPKVITSGLKINKILTIPTEPLKMQQLNSNSMIDIEIPSSYLGVTPIKARLLSASRRDGMLSQQANCRRRSSYSASNGLLIHCHGGGFVAQSSKSHEIYLREWATKLNVPILSIDYSLAPKAPFPRALEEVFYVYCWAINNCHLLGTTAEKIVLAGDSAGGNLCLGCGIKSIEKGIKKPDGIFIAYCPVLISLLPCPARMLSIMDPLLPFGFLVGCMKAYALPSDEIMESNRLLMKKLEEEKNKEKDKIIDNNIILSPTTTITSNTSIEAGVTQKTITDDNNHTFVNIYTNNNNNGDTISDNSDSFEENSVWEHVQASESDLQHLQAHKSPVSDGTSDTLAGASFRSQTTIGNVDLTPDETNGILFEEDDQPITVECLDDPEPIEDEMLNPLTAAEILELNIDDKNKEKQSSEYVSEFLERYVLDTAIDSSGNARPILRNVSRTLSEENIVVDIGRETITVQNIQEKLQKVAENFATTITSTITEMTTSNPIRDTPSPNGSDLNGITITKSPFDIDMTIPIDPYLSPFCADNEILRQMPPTKIVSVLLDPCLDDCVMYAKKLRGLNVPVDLDVVEGLPHGFLNFAMLSKEAHQGSMLCVKRIGELLGINTEIDNLEKRNI